jgi:hypothetical protein
MLTLRCWIASGFLAQVAIEKQVGGGTVGGTAWAASAKAAVPVLWIAPIDPDGATEPLTLERWVLAAVDFHCTDIGNILETRTGIDGQEIRSIIWQCSSSRSNKVPEPFSNSPPPLPTSAVMEAWRKLEPLFKTTAMQILRRMGAS